ncbi:MAG: magnesium-transporting ATPase (P-type) [Lentisphaeria bacterium]
MIVLLINTTIGTIQESSAQHAASVLQEMIPQFAAAYRDGSIQTIDATELVLGDNIPADALLIQTHELLADKPMLTGESLVASKNTITIPCDTTSLTE